MIIAGSFASDEEPRIFILRRWHFIGETND
nr:MAG TPA: hypothetical protein [Bacteriophage sp.]DAG52566.1 MAG TPA: hypothetical protein [Caudoviricetes sp.]DAH19755.1 MAG TPA: hypothetical protein [Caudoviricetes sp.]DAK68502.1 MAG TPA: hypothetical protein [Caudoviricetes sp.]